MLAFAAGAKAEESRFHSTQIPRPGRRWADVLARLIWVGALGLAAGLGVLAQTTTNAPVLANLSFEELSRIQIKIASVAERPVREQPAIVSVITQEEINETGARDLMDILALVPGFSFEEDISSAVGAGFRGFWAYEGKMLVLMDGIPVNDGLWGNVQLGHHYSAEQIKQVEIIRGPGSARYGGNAELAVVNITTKGAEQDGGFVSVRPEVVPGRVGTAVDGSVGYAFTNGWRFSVGVNYENFIRSDQAYVSQAGTVVDLRRYSGMEPYTINADLGWKDLDLRFIYDDFEFKNPLANGEPPVGFPDWSRTFRSSMGSAKYDFNVSDALTIAPKLTVLHQEPWGLETNPGRGDFKLDYDKLNLDIPLVATFNERNHLLAGVTGYFESAKAIDTAYLNAAPSAFFFGSDHVNYHDIAGYAQYDLDTDWANFTVGGRYESHDYAGDALVPRLGVTKAWERFHLKLLYDEAFRTPNIDDIYFQLGNAAVRYEKTASYQLESGYRFNDHLSAVANLYYMRIVRPIVFTVSGSEFGALNGGPLSDYGGEAELRYRGERFAGTLGYSYYQADQQLSAERLLLYGSAVSGLNLALPAHKVSGSGTFHLTKKLDWNLNATYQTAARAWVYPGQEEWLPAEFTLNTFIERRWKSFECGIGIQNLLDQKILLGQAYNGGAAPLPLLGRNYFVRLTYRF